MIKGLLPTSDYFELETFLKDNESELIDLYGEIEEYFIMESLEETDEVIEIISRLVAAQILSERTELSWPIPIDPINEKKLREFSNELFIFYTLSSLHNKGALSREDNIFDSDQNIDFSLTEKGYKAIETSTRSR